MTETWPADVPHKFVRDTYERVPEDIVLRRAVSAGPDLRKLRAGTRAQTIRGSLSASGAQKVAFELWRRETLDYGLKPFGFPIYDYEAARTLTVRMTDMPVYRPRAGGRWRIGLTLRADPPEPTPSQLSFLASLNMAAPAIWPPGVPAFVRREDYQARGDSRVLRPPEEAPASGALTTRLEGTSEQVSQTLTAVELEAFEVWFETDAAFGVRDIAFPVQGGVHTGCFASGYRVAAAPGLVAWRVSFDRYLEAQP